MHVRKYVQMYVCSCIRVFVCAVHVFCVCVCARARVCVCVCVCACPVRYSLCYALISGPLHYTQVTNNLITMLPVQNYFSSSRYITTTTTVSSNTQ